MYPRYGKKGKSLGSVDTWLDSLGYYRKNIAYDETCLFRAVSEQLFFSQIYHEQIRKQCIEYGLANYEQFSNYAINEEEWIDRLDRLKVHMLSCGDVEIQLISRKYNRDIFVFDASQRRLLDVTNRYESCDALLICKVSDDHYDSVYKKEHIATAGFCQSIVYKVLYEDVFNIPNVTSIVNTMLYKPDSSNTPDYYDGNIFTDGALQTYEKTDEEDPYFKEKCDECNLLSVAPFPFKVAKALDPSIYRNIEYDTWVEIRKELRLGPWYLGDDNLILGSACVLKDGEERLKCYIQEIFRDQNKCVVFITQNAERRTVNYKDLTPEDDAKPWPLPYRFSRSLTLHSSDCSATDKDAKGIRKRRDKRRVRPMSESNAQVGTLQGLDENGEGNHSIYEGCPLQMQNKYADVQNNNTETIAASMPIVENQMVQWEQWPQSNNSVMQPVVWNQQPVTPICGRPVAPMYNPPPLETICNQQQVCNMSSVTTTSSTTTYNEPPKLRLYCTNFCGDPYSPNGGWQNPDYTSPDQGYSQTDYEEQSSAEAQSTSHKYVYYPPESAYSTPVGVNPTPNERFVYSAPIPASSQVEMYPFVYPSAPPSQPVFYTPPVRPPDMMVPPPPIPIFTPPVEMQYLTPPPYAYTPTTPSTWYPTSRGFYFPAVGPQQPNV